MREPLRGLRRAGVRGLRGGSLRPARFAAAVPGLRGAARRVPGGWGRCRGGGAQAGVRGGGRGGPVRSDRAGVPGRGLADGVALAAPPQAERGGGTTAGSEVRAFQTNGLHGFRHGGGLRRGAADATAGPGAGEEGLGRHTPTSATVCGGCRHRGIGGQEEAHMRGTGEAGFGAECARRFRTRRAATSNKQQSFKATLRVSVAP
mmetsp:Transcript_116467/g.324575  ORF Transcript_116467/g.324575 Transcript_116467/m.324575 type:complete len:204 (-) Transcript_116467:25-636(-)